jgi:hypothetical protein
MRDILEPIYKAASEALGREFACPEEKALINIGDQ